MSSVYIADPLAFGTASLLGTSFPIMLNSFIILPFSRTNVLLPAHGLPRGSAWSIPRPFFLRHSALALTSEMGLASSAAKSPPFSMRSGVHGRPCKRSSVFVARMGMGATAPRTILASLHPSPLKMAMTAHAHSRNIHAAAGRYSHVGST